jgi:hypothetical protein
MQIGQMQYFYNTTPLENHISMQACRPLAHSIVPAAQGPGKPSAASRGHFQITVKNGRRRLCMPRLRRATQIVTNTSHGQARLAHIDDQHDTANHGRSDRSPTFDRVALGQACVEHIIERRYDRRGITYARTDLIRDFVSGASRIRKPVAS